jgi:hypothetical protein
LWQVIEMIREVEAEQRQAAETVAGAGRANSRIAAMWAVPGRPNPAGSYASAICLVLGIFQPPSGHKAILDGESLYRR